MQQRVRRVVFFVAGSSLVTAGLIVAACSTDNGSSSGTPTPVFEAGNKETATGDGPIPTDGGLDSTTDPDCAEAPRLRNNTGSFFCAFYRRDGGGDAGIPTSNCPPDETCCNPGKAGADFPPSFCAPGAKGAGAGETNCATQAPLSGSSWGPDGSTWECNDKQGCTGTEICCLVPGPKSGTTEINAFGKSEAVPPACNPKRSYNTIGTRCTNTAACAAGQDRLCSVADPCPTGFECIAIEALFRDVGYCKQKP